MLEAFPIPPYRVLVVATLPVAVVLLWLFLLLQQRHCSLGCCCLVAPFSRTSCKGGGVATLAPILTSVLSPGPLGTLFGASTLSCSGVGWICVARFLVRHNFASSGNVTQRQQRFFACRRWLHWGPHWTSGQVNVTRCQVTSGTTSPALGIWLLTTTKVITLPQVITLRTSLNWIGSGQCHHDFKVTVACLISDGEYPHH